MPEGSCRTEHSLMVPGYVCLYFSLQWLEDLKVLPFKVFRNIHTNIHKHSLWD